MVYNLKIKLDYDSQIISFMIRGVEKVQFGKEIIKFHYWYLKRERRERERERESGLKPDKATMSLVERP